MTDILSVEARSRHMAKIRGSDTKPEIDFRRALHSAGFRYRLHDPHLPGRPDVILKKYRAAVFVHGCFWHRHARCRLAYQPRSRVRFWTDKFDSNRRRDRRQVRALRNQGWRVLVVWECVLRADTERQRSMKEVVAWLKSDQPVGEIPVRPIADRIQATGGRAPSERVVVRR